MSYVGVKCLTRHCSVLRDTRTRGTTHRKKYLNLAARKLPEITHISVPKLRKARHRKLRTLSGNLILRRIGDPNLTIFTLIYRLLTYPEGVHILKP